MQKHLLTVESPGKGKNVKLWDITKGNQMRRACILIKSGASLRLTLRTPDVIINIRKYAGVAQSVEHLTRNEKVADCS